MELPDTKNWNFSQRLEWMRNCTPAQWDAICRGCGVCCLKKIDLSGWGISGVWYTRCACMHLNLETRKCNIYNQRLSGRARCLPVTLDMVLRGNVLPSACGYMEFLYGASPIRPNVNWSRIKNTPDDADDDWRMVANIIRRSKYWNSR